MELRFWLSKKDNRDGVNMVKRIVITVNEDESGKAGKIGIESGGLTPLEMIAIYVMYSIRTRTKKRTFSFASGMIKIGNM
jgi:hypothetical protein